MNKFSVTYEIVTEESAEDGDSAESGFVGEGLSLRDALDLAASTDSCHCGRSAVEASDSRPGMARWVTCISLMGLPQRHAHGSCAWPSTAKQED
jgi:hypothetical protein